jgi:hypothetical protein
MKCEKAVSMFLSLDNGQPKPLSLVIHTYFCPGCAAEIMKLEKVFKIIHAEYCFSMNTDVTLDVMKRINKASPLYVKEISYLKWISAGLVILASRFAVSYSDSMIWLNQHFGSSYEIPMNIVLGISITIYASMFISSHLDDLKKKLNFQ